MGERSLRRCFEEECQRRNIKLFVSPRSPRLNGQVERAHRTHREEFYELTGCSFELGELREELLGWEQTYNTIRPHQALGYLTPQQFLQQWKHRQRKEDMCH
jgi:transposase InsO family protein